MNSIELSARNRKAKGTARNRPIVLSNQTLIIQPTWAEMIECVCGAIIVETHERGEDPQGGEACL